MPESFLEIPAGGVWRGLPVSYRVLEDGERVLTGGRVARAVKIGPREIAVTIEHHRTGEMCTHAMPLDGPVWVHVTSWVNTGICPGMRPLEPTLEHYGQLRRAGVRRCAALEAAGVGTLV
jgi:hypothetical protein